MKSNEQPENQTPERVSAVRRSIKSLEPGDIFSDDTKEVVYVLGCVKIPSIHESEQVWDAMEYEWVDSTLLDPTYCGGTYKIKKASNFEGLKYRGNIKSIISF